LENPCNVGAPGMIRTCDARFRKPTLYPLSYGGRIITLPSRSLPEPTFPRPRSPVGAGLLNGTALRARQPEVDCGIEMLDLQSLAQTGQTRRLDVGAKRVEGGIVVELHP
jgi:hypothetical protein